MKTYPIGIRILPVILALASVAVAMLALGNVAFGAPVSQPSDLRVSMACSPLTSSQSAQPGDPQTCRIKVANYGSAPITGITVTHPTANTLVSTTYTGPFDLTKYQAVYITEQLTFNATQDGRGKTTSGATGTQNGVTISGSGTEQKSLQ